MLIMLVMMPNACDLQETGPNLNNKKKCGWVACPEAKLVFPAYSSMFI